MMTPTLFPAGTQAIRHETGLCRHACDTDEQRTADKRTRGKDDAGTCERRHASDNVVVPRSR
jgi:hypothetical protein